MFELILILLGRWRWQATSRVHARQRIWIMNRSPRLTFCRPKLLQILSPTPATADHPPLASCFPSPRHTWRKDLEQFRTTERWTWASIINSYSLMPGHVTQTIPGHTYTLHQLLILLVHLAGCQPFMSLLCWKCSSRRYFLIFIS